MRNQGLYRIPLTLNITESECLHNQKVDVKRESSLGGFGAESLGSLTMMGAQYDLVIRARSAGRIGTISEVETTHGMSIPLERSVEISPGICMGVPNLEHSPGCIKKSTFLATVATWRFFSISFAYGKSSGRAKGHKGRRPFPLGFTLQVMRYWSSNIIIE